MHNLHVGTYVFIVITLLDFWTKENNHTHPSAGENFHCMYIVQHPTIYNMFKYLNYNRARIIYTFNMLQPIDYN